MGTERGEHHTNNMREQQHANGTTVGATGTSTNQGIIISTTGAGQRRDLNGNSTVVGSSAYGVKTTRRGFVQLAEGRPQETWGSNSRGTAGTSSASGTPVSSQRLEQLEDVDTNMRRFPGVADNHDNGHQKGFE